ncbi:MAG: redox-sensing transcriptional repressor Rex [Bacteroidales bacterium]|nr:redox-sensing transcriptional repressor Rex [Bacteroidales bacterium]
MIKKNIQRIIQYRMCLLRFQSLGFERIFSYTLAQEIGVSPEQVRKDFSQFHLRGNKKAGYLIQDILDQINDLLHKEDIHKIIMVGLGNIGQALIKYKGFANRNMQLVAGFDIDPAKLKKNCRIPTFSAKEIPVVVQKENVHIGIIAVPEAAAQEVCNNMVEAGIKGILNFAPVMLKTPPDVVVQNISVCGDLEALVYVTEKNKKQES